MNSADMEEQGLKQGDTVTLTTAANDGVERTLSELQVVPYDIPRRTIAGYYPECNALIPLWYYAEGSKVPAAKSVPVRLLKDVVLEIDEETAPSRRPERDLFERRTPPADRAGAPDLNIQRCG